jgi:hypothetical protein
MKLPRLIVSIVASLLLAALAYFWATALMDSLYAFRSPLHNNPPQAGEPLGQPITRRVVLVLIDALRADTAAQTRVMPFLDELRQQGASATMHSRPPSYSAPSYSVIFTGAWPDLSDGPSMNPEDGEPPRAWTQDNLFSAAHRAGRRTAVSGFDWFQGLIPQDAVDAGFYTPGEDAAADRAVVDAALPWLESGDYQFILIHIDQVDYAGHHEGGPRDLRWNDAASRADALVKEIASHLDLTRDTVFVFSDHGQIDAGGHGGDEPVTLTEPFIAAGAGIVPGNYGDIQMVDLAPTVAALLGTNIPATSQGDVLTDMLVLTPEQNADIQQALSIQQTTLFSAYAQTIGKPVPAAQGALTVESAQKEMATAKSSRLTGERNPRSVAVIVLLAVIGFFLWKNWSHNFLWMALGAVVYALLFVIRYSFIAGRTYSLSSVASADELINFVATTSLISLVIPWWVLFTYLGVFKLAPRRAAEITFELNFAVLILLALPIGWGFALNGALVGWTLPNMPSMFVGFLCLLQTLIVAGGGVLLSGASAFYTWLQQGNQPLPTFKKKTKVK